ncbi:MAG: NADPH:quinone reductase [Pseudolabrys sp.]
MRAAYYEKNGTAREVLRVAEVETPLAGPGEVRVKLASSGVNPSDVKTRQGATRKIAYPRVIPHSDGAGVIDQAGNGVATSRIGERVWIWNGQWKRASGTAADYIVVPAEQAVVLPDNVSFSEGACFGIPATTAFRALELADLAEGATVLIAGGAGAVALYCTQVAEQRGCSVITTVSSAEKAALSQSFGAGHTINYKTEDVGERVMQITGKRGVDAVIELDLTANARLIPAVLRPKGSVIVYGTGPQAAVPGFFMLVNSIRMQFLLVYELDQAERERTVGAISHALEQRRLKHNVGQTFPLAEIAAAHEAVEAGAIGNVIVTL